MYGPVLSGLNVLELAGGDSVAFCSRLLGDYGAEVIKVEDPGQGDLMSRHAPFVANDPHPDKSIPFLYLNTNKRGVTLRFNEHPARELLAKLVSWADIMIEGFQPGYLSDLGLDYSGLKDLNPELVVVSITPFGQTGPYRDFQAEDIVACAMSGLMYLSGDADKEPIRNALSQSEYVAGVNAAAASLIAIFHRMTTGAGQHIDVSIVECLTAHLVQAASAYSYMGAVRGRRSPLSSGLEEIMPCRDGYCLPTAQGSQPWDAVVELLGMEELKDPKFATPEGRAVHGQELQRLLLQAVSSWDKRDLFHAAAERRLLFGMVQDAADLYDCPQLRARGFFASVDHHLVGKADYPGEIVRLSEGSFEAKRPAPRLGQHNYEVYCELLDVNPVTVKSLEEKGLV